MNQFFVILGELDKTWTPKKGKDKGIEQNETVYWVATKIPNNYILSQYKISDKSDYDYYVEGIYYKEIANTAKNFGSPEHLLNRYMEISDNNIDKDITTAKQWADRLRQQYLTKQEYLNTWLPMLNIKQPKEKEFTIKDE